MKTTRTDLLRDVNTWLRAERIDRHGQDDVLDDEQDFRLRATVADKLLRYYAQQLRGEDYADLKRSVCFMLFDAKESDRFFKNRKTYRG
jgi:hypothetical protein